VDRLTRRAILRRGLAAGGAVVVGSLLAACGSTPAAPTAQPAAAQPAPTAAPATQAPSTAATPIPASVPGNSTPSATEEAGVPGAELAVKPPQRQPITLRFHMRTGGDKSEPAIYVYRPQEWMQATGHKITLEPIPGDQNYIPKIEALAAGGTIGDLTWDSDVWSEHTALVKFGVLKEVESYIQTNKIDKAQWFKSITDALTYDGKMYGFPKTGHPGDAYIFINLKMFKDAGIAEPPVYGNTFDQVRQWANQLAKGPKGNREVYGYLASYAGIQAFTNGVRQFGGDIVSSDGHTSLVDSDAFAAWLDWHHKLIVEDGVHPFAANIPNGDTAGLFAAEKVAMLHVQRSFYFASRNAVKDKFPFKAIQFPRGQNPGGWAASIDTHSATAASKYADEALSLTYALADKRFAYLVGKFQGYLTGRPDGLDDLGSYAKDPFIQLQQTCTTQEAPFWRAANLRAREVESTMANSLDSVWLGKVQPGKAYQSDLKKQIDDVLAKPS
jgi:ABC-type glycerol-3-phosphate transport system substrate-binding protein